MLKVVLLITCLIMAGALEEGTIHIKSNGGQIESKRIDFNQPTINIPQVAISLLSSNHEIFAEVHDITNEGFTLQMIATQELEAEFAYIAVDDDENYQIECFNFQTVSQQIQFPLTISKPSYIGVLATNTYANNFNIDLLDGNLIVDYDGQLNMCIIITNQENPINLTGYSNFESQEVAQFHAFRKQNAMSLVQAQQSLEISHLDEHKSIEIWHHHSVEILKDSSLEVYPSHFSLEVENESKPKSVEIIPDEYKQKESLEIFKVDQEQLITEDVNLENISDVSSEDIKLDNQLTNEDTNNSLVKLDTVTEDVKLNINPEDEKQITTEDIKYVEEKTDDIENAKQVSEDIKLEYIPEDIKLENNSEDVKLIDAAEDVKFNTDDVKLENFAEDVKIITEDIKQDNEDIVSEVSQQENAASDIKLNDVEDVKLDNVEEEVKLENVEDVKLDNIEEVKLDDVEDVKLDHVEDVKLDHVSGVKLDNIEDVKLDNVEDVNNTEEIKQDNITDGETLTSNTDDVQLDAEDIRLKNVEQDSQQNTEDIKLDEKLEEENQTQENQQIQQNEPENIAEVKIDDIEQVATESDQEESIKLENIKFDDTKVETIKLEDIPVEQQASVIGESTEVSVTDQKENQENVVEVHVDEVQIENAKVSEINPEDVKIEDVASSEQIVTDLPNEKEQEIEDMLRAAQELKEEVKELKKKNKYEQFDEKRLIKEKAQQLEQDIEELEQDQPKVVEDDISFDVNQGIEPETTVVETVEQPPIIYLNDDGVNPEQQLIAEDVESDVQQEVDTELETQEQQELSEQKMEEQVIVDDQIKLDEDHQELEPEVEESVKIEEEAVDLDQSNDNQEFEIDLTTDEAEPFIKKPKKSDFLREKQKLKDKLTNVIRDLNLDSVDTTSLEGVEDQQKFSLIVDRLDVPENSENIIVLKDEDYQQEEEVQQSRVVNLGDYVSDIEPSVENVNFAYDDEVQEQIPIQVEDIKLDENQMEDDSETNYTVVEAKTDDQEVLQSVEEPEQELISSEVYVSEPEQEQEISLDEFQRELDELAKSIGEIKQENASSPKQSDYIVVNDNSQIYEASYDVQSYDSLDQNNDYKEELEDQTQYYQSEEQNVQQQQEQGVIVEQESTQQEEQVEQQESNVQSIEQDQQQQVDQQEEIQSQNQEQVTEQQEQQVEVEQQQSTTEDGVMQQERYDDAEPQDQYLTIDNLVADSSAQETDDAYDQPPQIYDAQEQESFQPDNEDNSEDFVVKKAEDFKSEELSIQPAQEQSNEESIEEATQVIEQQSSEEKEWDIIVDVANDDDLASQQSIDQDYDYNFEEEKQQSKQQSKKDVKQQSLKFEQVQPAKQNNKNKNKLQHSITIAHNQNYNDRSVHVQSNDMDETQEEMKQDLKQQLKQELKEELKQELQKEMQQANKSTSEHSLVVEEKVEKNPQRPAQKAINQFNDLLHDMVDNTLKESDNNKNHKLPIVDVNKESFKNVEPKIEAGIEDLKKALGLKGGVQVVAPDGSKQVINVDDLKKESQKLLSQPKQRKEDDSNYEEYLKKVTVKPMDQTGSYEEQHNIRKQEILENIKRELEIKKGRFTVPNDTPSELSPYEFERVYLDWEKNKQDIIPSMLQHSIDQPITSEQIAEVQQQKSDRVSRKEEVEKEVQELLYGNQKNSNKKGKMKEFRVEDLKYVKDDPLLDSTYRGFVQVKANLRKRKD